MKIFFFLIFSVGLFAQKKSLTECIDIAFENNFDIQNNKYNSDLQFLNYKIAKREYLPTINTSISNNMSFGVDQDVFGLTKRNDNLNNSGLIGMQFTIYNGGKNKYNLLKNDFENQAISIKIESTKRDVAIDILKLYLQVMLNKEIYNLVQNSELNAKKNFEKAQITTDLGSTPMTVLYEAKANFSKEKQNTQLALLDIKRSLLDLAAILQIEDTENFDIEDEFISDEIIPDSLIFSDILEKSFTIDSDIKSLESKLNSIKMQTKIAKVPMKPSIFLNTNFGTYYFNSFVSQDEENFSKQASINLYQQIRLNVNIPIFNKGINKLQVEKSLINEDIVTNEIASRKQTLKNILKKIFFEMDINYKNFIQAKEVEKNSKKSLDLVEKSYLEGYSTIYEVNLSVKNWLEAVSIAKQFKYRYLFNIMSLKIYSNNINDYSQLKLF